MSVTRTVARRVYHWLLRKTDGFLRELLRQEKLGLAAPLSGIARKVFVRERGPKETNYSSLDELKDLVAKATETQKLVQAHDKVCIPPNVRVLVIYPKYASGRHVRSSKILMQTNCEDVWVKTAAAVGITADMFDSTDISYFPNDVSNREVMARETDKLLSKVEEFQPHLIFLDVNYLGNANTINNEVVQEIRRRHRCRIAGHMGDYHSRGELHIAEYWSKSLDVVLHSSPVMSGIGPPNCQYVHYFQNERSFYPAARKSKDITFSGSGNIARYVYLSFVKSFADRRGYRGEVNVHYYDVDAAQSAEEYARLIRESRAVLNLTAKASGIRHWTGRMFEVIASKSLLLEEKHAGIVKLFTPYAHFIPFDSKEELAIAIDFAVQCHELVDKITEAAYQKYLHEYRSELGWSRILRLCDVSPGRAN